MWPLLPTAEKKIEINSLLRHKLVDHCYINYFINIIAINLVSNLQYDKKEIIKKIQEKQGSQKWKYCLCANSILIRAVQERREREAIPHKVPVLINSSLHVLIKKSANYLLMHSFEGTITM